MIEYTWAVWKDCRLVGYIRAFGELEALRKANQNYGERLFVERTPYVRDSYTQSCGFGQSGCSQQQ